jgi:hypothetical protein
MENMIQPGIAQHFAGEKVFKSKIFGLQKWKLVTQ